MPTLLFDGHETKLASASADSIWLEATQLAAATGFHLEPQGFCRGALCVPIPPSAKARFIDGTRVNVAALAAQLRRPVVHDEAHGVVSVGPEPKSRLAGAEAPDFTLPDFAGQRHTLSAYRGKKVLLIAYSSW